MFVQLLFSVVSFLLNFDAANEWKHLNYNVTRDVDILKWQNNNTFFLDLCDSDAYEKLTQLCQEQYSYFGLSPIAVIHQRRQTQAMITFEPTTRKHCTYSILSLEEAVAADSQNQISRFMDLGFTRKVCIMSFLIVLLDNSTDFLIENCQ